MTRRLTLLVLLAVLAGGFAWWLPRRRAANRAAPADWLARTAVEPGTADTPPPAANAPYAREEPSHLADRLNAPDGDIASDLRIVNDLFLQYRSATHGADPVGENAEITAALAGKNRLGFSFLPQSNPAINARGELCDRWGSPFFFHQLSGTQMEIRSAGPDRRLWTADDQVLIPGRKPPPL